MTRAFLFPGQGSQAVGMGFAMAAAFAPAREVFEEVDDALSQKLSRLMWEGPESDLILTENAQPAIMAASIAIVRILEMQMGLDVAKHARLVMGHSLGEYSALCAAGALGFDNLMVLSHRRGQIIRAASPEMPGGMVAIDASAEEAATALEGLPGVDAGVLVTARVGRPGKADLVPGRRMGVEGGTGVAGPQAPHLLGGQAVPGVGTEILDGLNQSDKVILPS